MVAKAGILMLAAAMWVCLSAVAAFDVPSVAFDEGFSPLFGDDNLVRARDDQSVRLLLDRRSGNLSPSSQSTPLPIPSISSRHKFTRATRLCMLCSCRFNGRVSENGLCSAQVPGSSPPTTTSTASSARPSSCPGTTRPASSSRSM
jgi:hypothetical protein